MRLTYNNLCADANLNSTAAGTKLQQWTCVQGSSGQLWTLEPISGTNNQVQVTRLGQCMQAMGGVAGTAAKQYPCSGSVTQRWTITTSSMGLATNAAFSLQSVGYPSRCLESYGGNANLGSVLDTYNCGFPFYQSFSLR